MFLIVFKILWLISVDARFLLKLHGSLLLGLQGINRLRKWFSFFFRIDISLMASFRYFVGVLQFHYFWKRRFHYLRKCFENFSRMRLYDTFWEIVNVFFKATVLSMVNTWISLFSQHFRKCENGILGYSFSEFMWLDSPYLR